jgi:hypothetical protein
MSRSVLAGATALALSFGPVAGVLIVLGGTSPSSQKEPQTAQEAFQSITKDWSKRYTTAKNEFLQEPMRAQRGADLCRHLKPEVIDWTGRVSDVSSSLFNSLSKNPSVSFAVDLGIATLRGEVPYSDPLSQSIKRLGKGDVVRFSGQFTLRANKDCFSEYSMTESGSMTSPGYTFKFTAVKPR